MNKKFIVIFDNLESFHLTKDVGMLPKTLKDNTNWDISIFSTLKKFNDLEFEKSVKLKFFTFFRNQKINKFFMFIDLILNAKNINYLMAFHGDRDKLILFSILKIINPNLITYIKFDMDEPTAYLIKKQWNNIHLIKFFIKKYLMNSVNLYSVETKKVFEIINKIKVFENKLLLLPNGFYFEKPYNMTRKKEKIIITVGRIGAPQKNNELLLSAISKVQNLGEYKFYFIGPIEKSFEEKVDILLNVRNDLRKKIILTGNISEKDKLFEYYEKAEVFCLTSIYEGFALVLTEALYHGCYLLSTDVGASLDLTFDGEKASIIDVNKNLFDELSEKGITDIRQYVNDNFEILENTSWFESSVKLLAEKLQLIINKDLTTEVNSIDISNHIYNNFHWNNISKKLINFLEDLEGTIK